MQSAQYLPCDCRNNDIRGGDEISAKYCLWASRETLYHRDDALLYIAYVMLI